VTVQRLAALIPASSQTSRRSGVLLWLLMGADAAAVVWMTVVGSWLDSTSRLTSVATLGGHHVLVMVLAGGAFGFLAATTPMTAYVALPTRAEAVLVWMAYVMSLVALAGLISMLVAVALIGLLTIAVGRSVLR
jgi:hypothetical protein